jgi:hypothetical protein
MNSPTERNGAMAKHVLVLAAATLALLAVPSIAGAETPNLHLLTEEGGSEVVSETKTLEATIKFEGGCTFLQASKLIQNGIAPLEVRSQGLKTEGCFNFKERFNKMMIHASGKIEITSGMAGFPTVEIGSCRYNVPEMEGALTIPAQVKTTVTGNGKLISGTPCESEKTVTATLTLVNTGNGHTTYVTT